MVRKKLGSLLLSSKKTLVAVSSLISLASSFGITACASGGTDINTVSSNLVKSFFNVIRLGGIIVAGLGVVQLFKAIQEGEAAPPNAVSKALGLTIGGIVMIALESVLKALGVETGNFKIVG